MSTASVPPPGWVEPQRPAPFTTPERPAGTDFAAAIAREDRRRLDTKRVKARFIDNLLLLPVYLLALHQWGTVAVAWALWALAHLIMAHFCEVTTGATPGKRFMKLRVADKDSGALPTPRQAATRGVIGLVESNLIGLIALHVSKGRTRLGDRAAGTIVVDTERHPVATSVLTRGALVYPALWTLPVALVCFGGYREHAGTSYRQQADAACNLVNLQIRATIESDGPYALQRAYTREHAMLAAIRPPAAWRDRHNALLARVSDLSALSARIVQDVEASKHPQQAWLAYDSELGGRLDAASAAAKAAGYHDCPA